MNVEQEISTKCIDMYNSYELFADRKASGFVYYNPVILERISKIMNRDSLNAVYKLAEDMPSVLRLDQFQHKPQNYKALTELAYTFHNVRFSNQNLPVLEKLSGKLNTLLLELKKLCLKLEKDTTEITIEEARAMAWDALPGINEYEPLDYVATVSNSFEVKSDNVPMHTKTDQYPYKFRFFKTYINGVCVGWEFFGQSSFQLSKKSMLIMKRFWLGLLLPLFYPATLLGSIQQQPSVYSISGIIKDGNKQPVKSATITLMSVKDTLQIIQLQSKADGTFEFKGLKAGMYKLKASAIGFKNSFSNELTLNGNLVQNLVLIASFKALKEVIVTSRRGLIEVSNGKIIYNIDKSASASGSSAFELLRRTPGVNVDQNDNLLLKGSLSVNVMMDGKMTYFSANQLANMLKGMGSNNISRIEVSNTPSSQYDAAGNGGVINIITKKNNKPGYAVNISSGIGAGRYLLNKHGISGNIRTSKFNVYGNIGYDLQRNFFDRSNTSILTVNGSATTFSRHYPESYNTYYYSYKAGVELYLTPKSTVGIVYTGFWMTGARQTAEKHS